MVNIPINPRPPPLERKGITSISKHLQTNLFTSLKSIHKFFQVLVSILMKFLSEVVLKQYDNDIYDLKISCPNARGRGQLYLHILHSTNHKVAPFGLVMKWLRDKKETKREEAKIIMCLNHLPLQSVKPPS